MSYDAARTTGVVFDVSTRGKIELVGSEAGVFLHNLSTNDVKTLPIGQGCETFFCTATAKVVAHGWIWRGEPEGKRERLWLDLDPGLGAKVYQHLDRYLISEDVTLTDRSEEWGQLHVVGPRAAELLAAAGVDPGAWMVRHVDPLGLPGCDVVGSASEMVLLRDKLLAAGAQSGDAETLDVLRVEAGTPLYGVDLDDTTFAPEVNRTAQAISYNKGCYLGQEPIVMARDRGVVPRVFVGLRLEQCVPAASLLYRDGKEAGRVTSCVQSPRFGAIALGYVRRGSQKPETGVEVETGGVRHAATVTALPFASGASQ